MATMHAVNSHSSVVETLLPQQPWSKGFLSTVHVPA